MSSNDDYGGAIDLEALKMSKFGSRPKVWMEDRAPISAKGTATSVLSSFERLPPELRQLIYSYLGIPIAGQCWSTCCRIQNCARIHRGQHYPANIPVKLRDIEFSRYDSSFEYAIKSSRYDYNGQTVDADAIHRYTGAQFSLLRVSKTCRADMLSLMFNYVYAVFHAELSIKPVHINSFHMSISPATFSYFTKVELSWLVGEGYNHPRPGFRLRPTPWVRRGLLRQSRSMRFIAAHCPFLAVLRFQPYFWKSFNSKAPPSQRAKTEDSTLECLVLALLEVVRKCEYLEVIEVTRPIWTYNIYPDGRKHSEMSGPGEYITAFNLKNIAAFLREDETRNWAAAVFAEAEKQGYIKHIKVHPFN